MLRSYCFKELIFLFSSNGAVGSGGAGGWTAPQANVRSLASPKCLASCQTGRQKLRGKS